ncbi:GNAT family N-acetyltransferase [Actinopolymorpha sp. B17G11]|uniref:GNAT family N-acetyltransferase n=1 Tax=Actinopolymorpha sp. B17G11 TaxID=3160861 RepID=UPI0032E453B7
MSTYTMRRAKPADLDAVMKLLADRISWLHDRGSNQWSTRDFRPIMTNAIASGQTWLLWDHQTPVATLSLTSVGDPDFWSTDERATPALYLSKLATAVNQRGRGLGAMLIDWANYYAAQRDVPTLRWDVWRTNDALQDYYSRIGIQPVRIAEVPGRWSGALYEVSYQASRQPSEIITEAAYGPLTVLDSQRKDPIGLGLGITDLDPHEARPTPHTHKVAGLQVPCLASPDSETAHDLVASGEDGHRILLYNPGTGWRLRDFYSHPIAAWTKQPQLQTGQLYHISHETPPDRACRITLNGDLDAWHATA